MIEVHKAETLCSEVGVGVEVFEGTPIGEQILVTFSGRKRRLVDTGDLRCRERLLHLRIGAEGRGPFLEQQVGAHVRGCGVPDTRDVLGAARLVIEVPGPGIGRPTVRAAVFEQVDESEGIGEVAMAEDEVLVVLDSLLAIQVDVKELALVERLGDTGSEVEPRHLFMTDLGVHAEQLGALEGLDERDRMPDRGQQDVPPRLIRLRLDRESDVVALVGHVLGEQVDRLAVTLEGTADVFGRVVLRSLPSAPHHEGLSPELDAELELPHRLAHGEAAHTAVIGGESSVLEDGCAEQVGRDHRDDHSGVGESLLQSIDLLLPFRIARSEGEQVVIVECEAVGTEFGEAGDGFDHVERRSGGSAEGVGSVVPHRPQAEGELIVAGGSGCHESESFSVIDDLLR